MLKKKAIIIGSEGQDGLLMKEYLSNKSYEIHEINKKNFNILNKDSVVSLIKDFKPHEVYFFAASHRSSQDEMSDFSNDLYNCFEINTISPIYFLDAILFYSKSTRFFFASSSLIFPASDLIINEKTKPEPKDPYAISKYLTMQSIKLYREKGVFAVTGILSNHESRYRKNTFLSKKIIKKAVDAYYGNAEKLIIGDMNSYVDWSYAPDVIKIINVIINRETPDDFIIASGEIKQVKDFLEIAFREVGLDHKDYIIEDRALLKRSNGKREFDISKLKEACNLDFILSFDEMIKRLIKEEISTR